MKKYLISLVATLGLIASPLFAHAAQIYFDPATGKFPPGVTFAVNVRLDNQGQCINAVSADITYPTNLLQAVSVSDGNSILSLWVKPPTIYSNYGVISFVGGLPGGYCGRVPGDPSLSNELATIYFRFPTSTTPVSTSTLYQSASLAFLSSTVATLNDGLGTFAPLQTGTGVYTPHPLKGQYISVDAFNNAIASDTTPPEPFTVGVYQDQTLFNDQWFAVFSTVDKQTGIDHYEVAEVPPADANEPQNQWNWIRAVSPYLIKDQSMKDIIAVRAIDLAGNTQVEQYTPPTPVQKSKNWEMSMIPYLAIAGISIFGIIQLILHIL